MSDPGALRWIDPPPAAGISEARRRLLALGAIDEDGRPTAHGKAIAGMPLPPRLAHMLVAAGERGWAGMAAEVAVLLTERGLGGNEPDLERRLQRWRGERGKRAEAARGLARRWSLLSLSRLREGAGGGSSSTSSPSVVGGKEDPHPNPLPQAGEGAELGACIALAFPDRVAKRRGGDGADWISVGGRGFKLDPLSPLAREPWLAVAETQGMAAGARILSAAPISEAEVEVLFGDRIETIQRVRFESGAVIATCERRLGAIVLARGPADRVDPKEIEAALFEGLRGDGLALLPWGEAGSALRQRAAFAGIADLSDARLLADLDLWLAPLLSGKRRLSDIDTGALHSALEGLIGWDGKSAIDRLAPAMLETPAGSRHAIDYGAEGGPAVEVRVQALFGMTRHPVLGDGTPLTLRLTSPAGRPIQTTKDLPGFWAGNWAAVAKEMRGRYPRHPWPDDPAAASATLRTKNADARRA